ncbi:uncharacterized protein BJX67DRAFT_263430 [Aspergillus lucknowensis]|uniref:DUF1279 domain-containing protein n=1 Tax=Aspergillus lucknowensis TaxID=176173 RepID=A0ABR4LFL5_9EURO
MSFRRISALSRPLHMRFLSRSSRRNLTTPPNPTSPPPPPPKDAQSRLRRFNNRLPSFLRAYTTPLLTAPATHVTSFLILHEISAVLPLFGLVAAFHYGNWLPDLTSYSGFEDGTRRFTRWLKKKGWVEDVDADEVASGMATEERVGVRLVLEFATAYVATKALLPLRIAGSVWATPWFARVAVAPIGRGVRGLFRRR